MACWAFHISDWNGKTIEKGKADYRLKKLDVVCALNNVLQILFILMGSNQKAV